MRKVHLKKKPDTVTVFSDSPVFCNAQKFRVRKSLSSRTSQGRIHQLYTVQFPQMCCVTSHDYKQASCLGYLKNSPGVSEPSCLYHCYSYFKQTKKSKKERNQKSYFCFLFERTLQQANCVTSQILVQNEQQEVRNS